MRKRFFAISIMIFLIMTGFIGCSDNSAEINRQKEQNATADKINVVVTIYPLYDWTREIIGQAGIEERINLEPLVKNGVDLHSYQPSAEDMIKIQNCDLLIYVGGDSEKWVDTAAKQKASGDTKVLKLLDCLSDYIMLSEMEMSEEHHHEGHEAEEIDEHIWLSLRNSKVLCDKIAEALGDIDRENSHVYEENCGKYIEKLELLEERYERELSERKADTVIFGDRFPFIYLFRDYDIDYCAAFDGCSAETEAGFETIMELAEEAKHHSADIIMITDDLNRKIAETIIKAMNVQRKVEIKSMYSLQSASEKKGLEQMTYLEAMELNLEALKAAMN